jgi:hypothetical protein
MKNFNPTPIPLRTVEQSEQRQADATAIVSNAIDRGPPDVGEAHWRTALIGLRRFVASGLADEALCLGWTADELYAVPPVWARVDLCGVGLLIGDREVVEITPTEIRIKIASGATQRFFRGPEPDLALVYRERLKLFGLDAGSEEVQLRALEHTVRFCRDNRNCDLETAKAAVLSAIKSSSSSPGVPAR